MDHSSCVPGSWVSGFTCHKGSRSLFQCPGPWIPCKINCRISGSESRVLSPGSHLQIESHVSGPTFSVLGLASQVSPMRWVLSLRSHQKPQILGPTFWICPKNLPWFSEINQNFQKITIILLFFQNNTIFDAPIFFTKEHRQKKMARNTFFQPLFSTANYIISNFFKNSYYFGWNFQPHSQSNFRKIAMVPHDFAGNFYLIWFVNVKQLNLIYAMPWIFHNGWFKW